MMPTQLKTFIPIDPAEELLKAVQIVHGPEYSEMWRLFLLKAKEKDEAMAECQAGAGI